MAILWGAKVRSILPGSDPLGKVVLASKRQGGTGKRYLNDPVEREDNEGEDYLHYDTRSYI